MANTNKAKLANNKNNSGPNPFNNGNTGNTSNSKPASNNKGPNPFNNGNTGNTSNSKPASNNKGPNPFNNGNTGNTSNSKPASNKNVVISKNKISPPPFNNNLKKQKYNNLPELSPHPISVDELYNKIDKLKSNTSYLKIVIGIVILLIIVGIIIYFFYYRKKDNVQSVRTYIEKQKSVNKFMIEGDKINLPKDGYDYSISFWLYIKDYYEDYTYWRHILHKGEEPLEKYIEYKSWNSLTQEFKEQSPGIWLHPSKNNIRLAFTTEIYKDYCNSNFLENTCIDKTYCMWDGLTCKLKNEHAFTDEKNIDYENTKKQLVEYIDLENIPIRNMVFISFSFEQKNLNVYMNGKLFKTKKFLGTPIFNKKSMYFNLKNTFNGEIHKFRYIPLSLNSKQLLSYYNDIPNVTLFPKKMRVESYAKQMKFKEMFKALFN